MQEEGPRSPQPASFSISAEYLLHDLICVFGIRNFILNPTLLLLSLNINNWTIKSFTYVLINFHLEVLLWHN